MSISHIAQAATRKGLSALSKSLRSAMARRGLPSPSHAAMRQILSEALGFTHPGALIAGSRPPATSLPFPPEEGFTLGRFALSFVELGEGYQGDYDPTDPEDCELLRVDLHHLDAEDADNAPEWLPVEGGSWCTQLPVSTAPADRARIAAAALTWVSAMAEDGSMSPRKLAERLSHLSTSYLTGDPTNSEAVNNALLRSSGFDEIEIDHALTALTEASGYDGERVLPLANGRAIRWDTDNHVRVTAQAAGRDVEVAYWSIDEVNEDPTLVVGAILGCAQARLE